MTSGICPVCGGPTHEIRAKLVCRRCGAILETCCEGGPMGGSSRAAQDPDDPAAAPARPESSDDFLPG